MTLDSLSILTQFDFSIGGKNDHFFNELTYRFVTAIAFLLPPTASLENVPGMLREPHPAYLRKVISDLLLLAYQVRICIVDAGRYGDPQERVRVVLYAARKGCSLPRFPEETHGPSRRQAKVTVADALSSLERILPSELNEDIALADGSIVLNHHEESAHLRKDAEKLVAHGVAKTVRRQNAIKHYSLNRCLTVRERARLQSFPDSFRFFGTAAQQSDQVGNAVPVNLAHAIAKSAMESHINH